MPYTFEPNEKYAKAYGNNLRISAKKATLICRVIRGKKLKTAKRLLNDLSIETRALDGKHYTKTVRDILILLNSCEKNAENINLNTGNLFVHASASKGSAMRRRRRKSDFGSAMKSANIEIYLVERGSAKVEEKKSEKKKPETKKEDKQKAGEKK